MKFLITKFGNGTPEVSVLVVRGNKNLAWWNQCLKSIKEQKGLGSWELITFEDLNHVHTIGEARNVLASEASSNWLYYLDDDDWLSPTALCSLLEYARQGHFKYVRHWSEYVDSRGQFVLKGYGPIGLISKEALLRVGPFKEISLEEDMDFISRAVDNIPEFVLLPKTSRPLHYYRLNEKQASNPNKHKLYETFELKGFRFK